MYQEHITHKYLHLIYIETPYFITNLPAREYVSIVKVCPPKLDHKE